MSEKDFGANLQTMIRHLSKELDKSIGQYGDFMKTSSGVFGKLQEELAKISENEELLDELSDIDLDEGDFEDPFASSKEGEVGELSEEAKALEGLTPSIIDEIRKLEAQGDLLLEKAGFVDGVCKVLERAASEKAEEGSSKEDGEAGSLADEGEL